jgi:hypothetical protein
MNGGGDLTPGGRTGKAFSRLAYLIWYGFALFLLLAYLKAIVYPALVVAGESGWSDPAAVISLVQVAVGLFLLGAVFAMVQMGLKLLRPDVLKAAPHAGAVPGRAFPAPVTLTVGGWVLLFTFASLVALILTLRFPGGGNLRGALLTMFAAGVGSSIATILGYLKHASEQQDFDPAYSAWYIGRPIIGALLGLLFYFVMKGGLVATVASRQEINEFGLVAVGGLVGLFSKNAVEKLREMFNVLFQTREQSQQELLDRLPDDLKTRIKPYLTSSDRPASPPRRPPSPDEHPSQSDPKKG